VKIRELSVPGAWVLDLTAHDDDRGRFVEWYRADLLSEVAGCRLDLAQANHSVSARGVLRGIHATLVPPGQAKYVYCPAGAVLDVVVDVRDGSPTFGRSDAVLLSPQEPRAVFIGEGLGHAFLSLEDGSSLTYLVSSTYDPRTEVGINPLDPELELPWPTGFDFRLSAKDAAAPTLREAREKGLLPTMAACTAQRSGRRPATP
jgi:dTDP-4-dehydrorhamnose 3,5-epimerase